MLGRALSVVAVAWWLSPQRAAAQPGDAPPAAPDDALGPLGALSIEELLEVPVFAPAKLPQSVRDAPAVGAVITREQARGHGWRSVNDVLFRQPGFAPAGDYERVTVSARGLYEGWNNNHLLLLVDGVPINNASNGTAYTWEVLPLFVFERVEVLRGPGSALYGSNATNGVVALETWSPVAGTAAEAQVRLGNAGGQSYDVLAGQASSWLALTAAYSHHRTDGNVYRSLDGSGRTDAGGALASFAVNDRRASHFGLLKLEGRGPLAGLALQAHLQRWRFQTGHGWLYWIPDADERAVNGEARAWLRYHAPPLLRERLTLELVGGVQRHEKDYRIKYLPSGASFAGVSYPGGVVERIVTGPTAYFTRAQAQLRLVDDMILLAGVENHLVSWGRDRVHEANVDLGRGGGLAPYPDGAFRPQPPALESVLDDPIDTVGLYLQYASGRVLADSAAATVGVRYDRCFFDYLAVAEPGQPRRHRAFDQLSPRLGLVMFVHPEVTLKAMAERAFRAPSPSELVINNTLLASSNTAGLKPEQLTTVTAAVDARLGRHLNLRADWFYERFANQIAFSTTDNGVANVYSRTTTGLETELLFDARVPLPGRWSGQLSGFANYSFTHLLDEDSGDASVTPMSRLTWAPAHLANAGLLLATRLLELSVQGHLQGRVHRRDSDRLDRATGTPTPFSAARPRSVAPWFTLDARVGARPTRWLRLGVQGNNLTGSEGHLIKIGDYPFDFRIEGPRVMGTLELTTGM
jgi:outer membrane receptor protein involved in Fe transport